MAPLVEMPMAGYQPLHGMQVTVVDDHDNNRSMARVMLEQAGATARLSMARGGHEATYLIRQDDAPKLRN